MMFQPVGRALGLALVCLAAETALAGPTLTVGDAMNLSKATGRPIFAVAGTET